jgi:hypothetical protein
MATDDINSSGSGLLNGLASISGRAAAVTLRPFAGVAGAAVSAGVSLERRALDRVLASEELERITTSILDSPQVQAAIQGALESEGARRLIDGFFESGLLDDFLHRLANSDALWTLIDEIAGSPAVTAAISQQGLGFADQVGGEVRARSRKADDWLERAAQRLTHRRPRAGPAAPDPGAS